VNIICFFSLVDCCLAAQIADFGQNGPNVASQLWCHRFRGRNEKILPQKITLVTLDNTLNDGVNKKHYYCKLQTASGVERHGGEWHPQVKLVCKMPKLLILKPNLVPSSSQSTPRVQNNLRSHMYNQYLSKL
jgi:hypothetical protein